MKIKYVQYSVMIITRSVFLFVQGAGRDIAVV